jgi:hypothetical protein
MVSPWGLKTLGLGNLERGWRKRQAHKNAISNNNDFPSKQNLIVVAVLLPRKFRQLIQLHSLSNFAATKLSQLQKFHRAENFITSKVSHH